VGEQAPSIDETLGADWTIDPAQGRAFDVISNARSTAGRSGSSPRSGSPARPPGTPSSPARRSRTSSTRAAWRSGPSHRAASVRRASPRVPVRNGLWSFNRFLPDRRGRWELYARYRTTRHAYANDASQCGTFVTVR
jgi:hypothetical protein